MKFKALIFDLDGTAIPTGYIGKPSQKLIDTIKKAKKIASCSIATARRISSVRDIIYYLDLESPSIITNGTQIIHPRTEKIIWEKTLNKDIVKKVVDLCISFPGEIILGNNLKPVTKREEKFNNEPIIYIRQPTKIIAENIVKILVHIPGIKTSIMPSWNKGWTDVHVINNIGGKDNAMKKLIEILGVNKNEVIAVGDNNNDEPLFQFAGYKVAMGNATEELKSKADYVGPSQEDDGLAFIINKFITL